MQPCRPLFAIAPASSTSFIGNLCTKHVNRWSTSAIRLLHSGLKGWLRDANVLSIMGSIDSDLAGRFVCNLASRGQILADGSHTEHSSARRVILFALPTSTRMEKHCTRDTRSRF